MRTSQAAVSLSSRQAPSASRILDTGTAFWASKTLLSAVELGVFTQLGPGPLPLEPLRERLGLHPRAARDFLDALVALGFLDRDGSVYRNAPDAAVFLDKAKPSYIGGLLEMLNERLYGFWGRLTEALRTGEPQNESRAGRDPFETLYASTERMREFLSAMTGVSLPTAQAVAARFPWAHHRTLFDIGTAQGCLPIQVASAHPHITGGGMDLPKVGPVFEEYVREHGLSDRLRFVAGDMFRDDWPPADVYVMGHILHDWSRKQKRELLAKAYASLPTGGALIVYDAIIDDDRRENAFGLLMSLNMLIETPGGFDYTGRDCEGWMRDAGFTQIRGEHLVGPDSMVVGIK